MTIQLQNFSSKIIYVQDVLFIVKGFAMKLSSKYSLTQSSTKLFPFETFYVYGIGNSLAPLTSLLMPLTGSTDPEGHLSVGVS